MKNYILIGLILFYIIEYVIFFIILYFYYKKGINKQLLEKEIK
jgi:hypothetical protein